MSGSREKSRTRAFVQHKVELPDKTAPPGQRKWVAKISPSVSPLEASPASASLGLDCLAKLKSSNRQAMEAGKVVGRTRMFASKRVSLPVIAQEVVEEEMVVREEKEEMLSKSLSSPTETEDDSGIFTSAHSKYSLDSLGEELKSSTSKSSKLVLTEPATRLSRSLPPSYGWSADVQSIQAKAQLLMARSADRPNLRGFAASRSVHNFSDSAEEFASRETSPMALLEEICHREEDEQEEKGRRRITPGLVQSRKQWLEGSVLKKEEMMVGSPRPTEERDSGEDPDQSKEKKLRMAKPKLRSFVGLRNSASPQQRGQIDFTAISGLPSLDHMSLLLSPHRREIHSKEASPSLSEVSSDSSELTSVSLPLEQLPAPSVLPVMSTSTTSSSNLSQVQDGGKKTASPDQADFLIDDDYNDQQELTFYGHEDSMEESLFEKVDSLLSRRQESQEQEQEQVDQVDGVDKGVGEVVEVNVDFSPVHLPKLEALREGETRHRRASVNTLASQASVDTLASQASIAKDEEEAVEDCMLDFDFER